MGVRVFDSSESCDEDCKTYCSCCNENSSTTTSTTTSTPTCNKSAKPQTNYKNTVPGRTESATERVSLADFKMSSKDLVGNCKKFRIENNKCDLRIIGNGNRIRISNNSGNLNIIGNTTRVKITQNSGQIKYTGNEGRIYLGSESTQQLVDYIGCNGILKVVNGMDFSAESGSDFLQEKCKQKSKSHAASKAGDANAKNTCTATHCKSASYGGLGELEHARWQHFGDSFRQFSSKAPHVSLPDLQVPQWTHKTQEKPQTTRCDCCCKCKAAKAQKNKNCNIRNEVNVVHHAGDIVIKNAVNVSI